MLRNTYRTPRLLVDGEDACLLLTKVSIETNYIIKKREIFRIYVKIGNQNKLKTPK